MSSPSSAARPPPDPEATAAGFVACCVNCGAAQPLALRVPVVPCPHCGAADPLDAATRARVLNVVAQLSRVVAREQRVLAAQLSDVTSLAWMVPVFAVVTWALFGGFALALVGAETEDGFLAFLRRAHTASDGFDGGVAMWWLLFALVAGLAVTLSSYLGLLHRIRGQVRVPPSLPPLSAGAPPRCRVCGGLLAGHGVRRACGFCGAANLADGHAVTASTADLTEQLRLLEQRLLGATGVTHDWAFRLIYATAAYPIVLILAVPAGLWLPATRPDLLWILALLAAPAPIFALLVARQSLPPDPGMAKLRPGDRIRVRGVIHQVHGKLDVNSGQLPTEVGVLFLIGPDGGGEPTLAAYFYEVSGVAAGRAFAVEPGGAPLEPGAVLSRVGVDDVAGHSDYAAPRDEPAIRLFDVAQPAPGSRPRWTLTATDLDADDLVAVG